MPTKNPSRISTERIFIFEQRPNNDQMVTVWSESIESTLKFGRLIISLRTEVHDVQL